LAGGVLIHAIPFKYDPKVTKAQICRDLEYLARSQSATYGDLNGSFNSTIYAEFERIVTVHSDPSAAIQNAHAIAILTEWDEFKTYDWQQIYHTMLKPAFVFDGRNVLDGKMMKETGFEYKGVGKS
jgi:UDPglucose 6-dehydrogenase